MGLGGMIPSDDQRFDGYEQQVRKIESSRSRLKKQTLFDRPMRDILREGREIARKSIQRFRANKLKETPHDHD